MSNLTCTSCNLTVEDSFESELLIQDHCYLCLEEMPYGELLRLVEKDPSYECSLVRRLIAEGGPEA